MQAVKPRLFLSYMVFKFFDGDSSMQVFHEQMHNHMVFEVNVLVG